MTLVWAAATASQAMVEDDADHGRRVGVLRQRRRREEIMIDDEDELDNSSGVYHRQQEKKRRLSVDQVQYLEKSFEVEDRLEPDRKLQLAKELGLQPRQVAIWFQNRRARFKSKQLEKDYDSLKADYDHLKADYDSLLREKDRLKNEVALLTNKLKLPTREKTAISPNCDPPSSPLPDQEPAAAAAAFVKTENVGKMGSNSMVVVCKQEDASSAKSDVLDSESPHGTEGNRSWLLETVNSSNNFLDPDPEPDPSQVEEDQYHLCSRLLPPPPPALQLPMLLMPTYDLPGIDDEECYSDDLHCNSGTPLLGLPAENQQFWPWLCQS
ncbi:hypothetical protein Dimus_014957 [Dionaea muscipula]